MPRADTLAVYASPVPMIDQEHCGHEFFEHGGRYFLTVPCGTVAVFDLTVELAPHELAAYEREGLGVIRSLADQIRFDPDSYQDRHRPGVYP
jgi:hypothetical protein